MTQKEKIDSIISTHNAIIKYYDYILKQNYSGHICSLKQPLNEDDIYRVLFSFVQLDLLLKKDSIAKRVDGEIEVYIDDFYLEKFLSTIATKEPDGRFTISDVTDTKEELISIIRHKLAHADYYYSSEKKAVILIKQRKDTDAIRNLMIEELTNKYSAEEATQFVDSLKKKLNKKFEDEIKYDQLEMEIPIDKFLNFYEELQEDLYTSYNSNVFTRNIVANIADKNNLKVIKTEQEALNFIKLFTHKKYTLTSYDNKKLMPSIKDLLNILIYKSTFNTFGKKRHKDLKVNDEEIIKDMKDTYHHLVVENKKIKDKETIDNIVKALLLYKDNDDKVNKDALLYRYENVVTKILNDRYGVTGIDYGILSNIKVLKNLLNLSETERDELLNFTKPDLLAGSLILNDYDEMAATIMLIGFMNIYGYPLEKVYKNDKNYHLVRNHLLDFGKLKLNEFTPDKINLEKKGLNEINKEITSKENSLKSSQNNYEELKNKYQEFLEKEMLTENQKKGKKFHEEMIAKKEREIMNKKRQLYLLKYKRNLIIEDYTKNNNHFINLEIIEGIRNSLYHGNVKLLNNGVVSNFYDLVLEFTNIYEGKEEFKIKLTLSTLNRLFEPDNISVLENFLFNESNLYKEESCFVKTK